MAVSRHGRGAQATLGALASQVHPVFMLPPFAASWFGSVLAGRFWVPAAALHALAIFTAVYTAHVKDGYVDYYGRGEDDDHPMTARGCRLALATSSTAFWAAMVPLWLVAGPGAVALTVPGWLIGYLHAPQLDTHPLGATAGYPAGIALAILGGFYVQAGTLAVEPVGFAAVFLVLLSGVKVVDDATDHEYDRSIDKRTVAVLLGPAGARRVAYGLMATALLVVAALSVARVFPPSAALATVPFGAVAVAAGRADEELATMLLIRGSYLFIAVLIAAAWLRPLA